MGSSAMFLIPGWKNLTLTNNTSCGVGGFRYSLSSLVLSLLIQFSWDFSEELTSILFFFLFLLRPGFVRQPKMAWNSLHSLGWPWPGDFPVYNSLGRNLRCVPPGPFYSIFVLVWFFETGSHYATLIGLAHTKIFYCIFKISWESYKFCELFFLL